MLRNYILGDPDFEHFSFDKSNGPCI